MFRTKNALQIKTDYFLASDRARYVCMSVNVHMKKKNWTYFKNNCFILKMLVFRKFRYENYKRNDNQFLFRGTRARAFAKFMNFRASLSMEEQKKKHLTKIL